MAASLKYTKEPHKETYSEIIDVRSSSEFAEDRIPGAINLPVLNDAERAEVGTIYKQFSPFQARKIGAAIVSKNISKHLNEHFANKEKSYQPLIYCWRGGQRSASLATVLSQIGWRVTLLEGGYKTYRSYVRQELDSLPQHPGNISGNSVRMLKCNGALILSVITFLINQSVGYIDDHALIIQIDMRDAVIVKR